MAVVVVPDSLGLQCVASRRRAAPDSTVSTHLYTWANSVTSQENHPLTPTPTSPAALNLDHCHLPPPPADLRLLSHWPLDSFDSNSPILNHCLHGAKVSFLITLLIKVSIKKTNQNSE